MKIDAEHEATAANRLAEDLAESALVDTVYGDLYLQRAREFLAPTLREADFDTFQLLETEVLNLPHRIAIAMNQGNWTEVKDLSWRMESLKQTLAEKETLRRLGERIYRCADLPLDPFSPGFDALAKRGDTQELLHRFLAQLDRLQAADPEWRDFYAARRSALAATRTYSPEVPGEADLGGAHLEAKALEALNNGNFAMLEKIADLIKNEVPSGAERTSATSWRTPGNAPDLTFDFPQQVLKRAAGLGLGTVRIEAGSRAVGLSREDLAPIYRHLWHPAFTDRLSRDGGNSRKEEIALPADAPAAFRDLVELFTLYPFVNSGGARYVPTLAEEDVLIEDFDEPDPGTEPPPSVLLSALGFDERRGLSRNRLEKALIDRGSAIIEEIGLDPRLFRLVCIPADVYGRVGAERGWGRKAQWTHFDGYLVMSNGKFGALAGGDVRFGGLYDLVGIGREYDSERIIARFAVVQRRRMELPVTALS